jgi:hypothetical protein
VRARRSRNVAVIEVAEDVSTADETIECPLTLPTLLPSFDPTPTETAHSVAQMTPQVTLRNRVCTK